MSGPSESTGALGPAVLSLLTIAMASGVVVAQEADKRPAFGGGLVGFVPEPGMNNWRFPASPAGNPFHRPGDPDRLITDQMVRLGKSVFWDEQLSSDNTMSCGSCHFPESGGAEFRPALVGEEQGHQLFGSAGVIRQDSTGNYQSSAREVTGFNAPSVIGAAYFAKLFWEGRADVAFRDENGVTLAGFEDFAALEEQAAAPPTSDIEMAHEEIRWDAVAQKLGASKPLALVEPSTLPADVVSLVAAGVDYNTLFDSAFQNHSNAFLAGQTGATRERICAAIAHYERTLVPNEAPIDTRALTPDELEGFRIMNRPGTFLGQSCFFCHGATITPDSSAGAFDIAARDPFDQLFSDGGFHPVTLPSQQRRLDATGATVPGPTPPRSVKTPSLRNVALRKRFMSTGELGSLDEVLAFYNSELDVDPLLAALPLAPRFRPALNDEEKGKVAAFLRALTDRRLGDGTRESLLPPFDRPLLYSERPRFGPALVFPGIPGISGEIPEIIANAPPRVDQLKFGVVNDPVAATAVIGFWHYPTLQPLGFQQQSLGAAPVSTWSQALRPQAAGISFLTAWVFFDSAGQVTSFSNVVGFRTF